MSVLIEAISVVIRISTIKQKYRGGLTQYRGDCPNGTFCADEHLTRVGFMAPPDVQTYVQGLERQGFVSVKEGRFVDIAIVDQCRGFTAACDWASFDCHPGGYAVCSLLEANPGEVAVPSGWGFEKSLSDQFNFVPNEDFSKRMQFLRHENGMDVFLDRQTGKTVYLGRLKGHQGQDH